MLRIVLITLVLLLTVTGGVAILLFQQFGWEGLFVLPFLLIGLGWLTKTVVSRLIRNFLLKAFALKSDVLHLADITIHSVIPVSKPPAVIDISDERETYDSDEVEEDNTEEEPMDYFEAELTITPERNHEDGIWEPGELILMSRPVRSLLELEDADTVGTIQQVQIWEGGRFLPGESGKYHGEQKLRVTFEVNRGIRKAVVQYYNHALGEIAFPSPQLAGETIVDV